MGDKFGEIVASVAVELVTDFVPGSGAVLAIFKGIVDDNDERFKEALVGELHDHVNRLQSAVDELRKKLEAQGKRLDDLDLIAQRKVVKEYVDAIGASVGEEKRLALVRAAARQYDPDAGTLAMRSYWMGVIGSLSDVEVSAISLCVRGAVCVKFAEEALFMTDKTSVMQIANNVRDMERHAVRQSVDFAHAIALRDALGSLGRKTPPLVQAYMAGSRIVHPVETDYHNAVAFILTESGRALLEFMQLPTS